MSVSNVPVNNDKVLSTFSQASKSKESAAEGQKDQWKFGSSVLRIDANGQEREATLDEILAETKSSPAAMVKILGAGADLLRFDGNGEYRDASAAIAALYSQEGKSTDEIAAEVRSATEALRARMREDIKNGVFTVNDSGQVFHRGEAIPAERVGFELNGLLIESTTDKVGELNALVSQLAAVDEWVSDNLGDKDYVVALYDFQERHYVESRKEFPGGSPVAGSRGNWNQSHDEIHKSQKNQRIEAELETWKTVDTHESEFSKFARENADNFPGLEASFGKHGDVLIGSMRDNYERLLEGSGLATREWLQDKGETDQKKVGGAVSGSSFGMSRVDTGSTITRYEVYRAQKVDRKANQLAFSSTALTEAKENVRSRTSTLATLSEQLGTNFKVDNSRFNSIIEAMNSYNKSVVDSLRRFSVF